MAAVPIVPPGIDAGDWIPDGGIGPWRTGPMRALQVSTAAFLVAAAMFVMIMLVTPPTSEAAAILAGTGASAMPLVLVGP